MYQPRKQSNRFRSLAALTVGSLALIAGFYAAKLYLEKPVTGQGPQTGIVVKNPDGSKSVVDGFVPVSMSKQQVCRNGVYHYTFGRLSDGTVEGRVTKKEADKATEHVGTYSIGADDSVTLRLNTRMGGIKTYRVTFEGKKTNIELVNPSFMDKAMAHVLPRDLEETVLPPARDALRFKGIVLDRGESCKNQ